MEFQRYPCRLMAVKSSAANDRAVMIVMQRIQEYNARSINYNMRKVFASMHRMFKELEGVPGTIEIANIVFKHTRWETAILTDAYNRMADAVYPLIADENGLKAAELYMEHKANDQPNYKRDLNTWIFQHLGVHISDIDDTTMGQIRVLAAQAATTADFQKSIKGYFASDAPSRAYTIARTEAHGAATASADMSVRNTDVGREKVKVWRTTKVNTRPTHAAMDGVQVGMDDAFQVPRADGGYDMMMYPGDGTYAPSAGNVVNCRCLCFYRYA